MHKYYLPKGILLVIVALMLCACYALPVAEPSSDIGALNAAVPGVTDDEIVLGAHTPLTGPLANFSQINQAALAYFSYINETENGIHGRQITYLLEDDQYSPPLTEEVTQKLVEEIEVFAIVGGLGTPTHLAVVDYLEEQGVPDLFVIGGSTEWTKDPVARPSVFGAVTHYAGEGAVLGRYLLDTYSGKKLGIIHQDTGFEAGIEALKRSIGDSLEIVAEESYTVGPPDLSTQVSILHDAGTEVIVAFSAGPFFGSVVQQARTTLNWDVPILGPGPAMSGAVMVGAVAEGTVSVDWQRSLKETEHQGIVNHLAIIDAYSDLERATPETLFGQLIGEMTVEVLQRAGPELTREGVIMAAESIQDWRCSICLYPINMSDTDHSPIDVAILSRFDGKAWIPFGDGYSWEGILPGELSADNLQVVSSPYQD
ncbi:MAG: ABC transporter substrate-binding protein [Chloroflexota bacterium]